MSELLAITDRRRWPPAAAARPLAERLGPRLTVLVREKDLRAPELAELVAAVQAALDGTGARVAVSDNLAVAKQLGVGVHLSEAGPTVGEARAAGIVRVGVSRHDRLGLERSSEADYATLSPVLASPKKGSPLGWDGFAAARIDALPVFALGGIGPADVADALRFGAGGVAAIRAAWEKPPAAWDRATTCRRP